MHYSIRCKLHEYVGMTVDGLWWNHDYAVCIPCANNSTVQLIMQTQIFSIFELSITYTSYSQTSLNITEPYNSSSYAMDAVMTLALALNETLESPSLNLSLQAAIEDVMFSGTSVI